MVPSNDWDKTFEVLKQHEIEHHVVDKTLMEQSRVLWRPIIKTKQWDATLSDYLKTSNKLVVANRLTIYKLRRK